MMPPPPLPDLVQQMNLQRYNDLRFRAYCCGCIHSSINHPIIYFLWAVNQANPFVANRFNPSSF